MDPLNMISVNTKNEQMKNAYILSISCHAWKRTTEVVFEAKTKMRTQNASSWFREFELSTRRVSCLTSVCFSVFATKKEIAKRYWKLYPSFAVYVYVCASTTRSNVRRFETRAFTRVRSRCCFPCCYLFGEISTKFHLFSVIICDWLCQNATRADFPHVLSPRVYYFSSSQHASAHKNFAILIIIVEFDYTAELLRLTCIIELRAWRAFSFKHQTIKFNSDVNIEVSHGPTPARTTQCSDLTKIWL